MRLRGELGGGEINISVRLSRPSGLHLGILQALPAFSLRPAPCSLLTSHRSSLFAPCSQRPAPRASLFHRYRPVGAMLPVSNHHQPSAAHLADDLAPLGLCCKNITIACSLLYSAYYLLQTSATHLADDIAPLGLCCKNIIIASSILSSAYCLLRPESC